jgi:aldose 1-epimerase
MNVLKRCFFGIGLLSLALVSVQCKNDKKMDDTTVSSDQKAKVTIEKSSYGTTAKGEKVDSYKLKNQNGMEVDIITFGGRITD